MKKLLTTSKEKMEIFLILKEMKKSSDFDRSGNCTLAVEVQSHGGSNGTPTKTYLIVDTFDSHCKKYYYPVLIQTSDINSAELDIENMTPNLSQSERDFLSKYDCRLIHSDKISYRVDLDTNILKREAEKEEVEKTAEKETKPEWR